MKQRTFIRLILCSALVGLASFAFVSVAQTSVSSTNIVGYYKLTIDRGSMVLIRNDFKLPSGTNPTPRTLFGNSLPLGTEVLSWNSTKNPPAYDRALYRSVRGVTSWSSDIDLQRGKGFWVKIPATAAEPTYTVFLTGEVPSDASSVVAIAEGLNMVAYAFPTTVLWTNTSLAKSAVVGDEVSLWDPAQKIYKRSLFRSVRGVTSWSDPNLEIPVGRGVWFKTATPRTWTEPRPY